MSIVYFVSDGEHIKVGVTSNITKRLAQLQTSNARSLEVLATLDGDTSLERELHQKFSHLRANGEWFKLCDEILTFIREAKPLKKGDVFTVLDSGYRKVRKDPHLFTLIIRWGYEVPYIAADYLDGGMYAAMFDGVEMAVVDGITYAPLDYVERETGDCYDNVWKTFRKAKRSLERTYGVSLEVS